METKTFGHRLSRLVDFPPLDRPATDVIHWPVLCQRRQSAGQTTSATKSIKQKVNGGGGCAGEMILQLMQGQHPKMGPQVLVQGFQSVSKLSELVRTGRTYVLERKRLASRHQFLQRKMNNPVDELVFCQIRPAVRPFRQVCRRRFCPHGIRPGPCASHPARPPTNPPYGQAHPSARLWHQPGARRSHRHGQGHAQ